MPTQQNEPSPLNRQPLMQRQGFWWLMMLALLVWNIVVFWPKEHPEVTIPYTTFLAQIRAGNVTRVHVVGDRISGTFKQSVSWPLPAQEQAALSPKTTTAAPPVPTSSYTAFDTTFPEAMGDPGLLPLLESHGVEVSATTPATPWFITLLIDGFPMLLLVGFFVWMGRKAASSQSNMFGFGRSKARRYTTERSEVTFADVSGADEAKAELLEEVDFLRQPQKYHDLGARIPRGVLLVGPPGAQR